MKIESRIPTSSNRTTKTKCVLTNCNNCGTEFWKANDAYQRYNKHFCSRKCMNKKTKVTCKNCGKLIYKKPCELKMVKNSFCNQSCSATYNNKHNKSGTRRSKLEKYIEQRLKEDFPTLKVVPNDTVLIGSELDFYFPQLRIAVEINGIVHYEPIYGDKKFQKIVDNDKQKMIRCYEQGIELIILDSSKLKYFKPSNAEEYYLQLKRILESKSQRLESN